MGHRAAAQLPETPVGGIRREVLVAGGLCGKRTGVVTGIGAEHYMAQITVIVEAVAGSSTVK